MNFTPSANNYAKIYLMSDEADLSDNPSGLFVRIGYTDKNISLVRARKGRNNEILIAGEKNRLNGPAVTVQVTWDARGELRLCSRLDNEAAFREEGRYLLQETPDGGYFGLVCVFTPTRNGQFFFDNFTVSPWDDDNPGATPDEPHADDMVFTEIMANPGSGSNRPEYIELYNTTGRAFQLNDCLFYYGDRAYSLPKREIPPHTYFILCKTAAEKDFPDIEACGTTAFPTLANSGKLLRLDNRQGETIAWFEYSDAMYNDAVKKTGGWSLECIDWRNRSNTAANWSASVDASGGTPGRSNSIQAENPDLTPPAIRSATWSGAEIGLTFSKPMDPASLLDETAYRFSDTGYHITGLDINRPQATTVQMQLNRFPPQGEWLSPSVLLHPWERVGYHPPMGCPGCQGPAD
jgi:hypothetical protein